tara:strand:- start:6333 stop:8201 length:1869 start_codon:yes stop_codon:yes gene_type:complete
LYWPLKRQKKTDTPVEFFLHGRQIPGWIFALVATGTIFSGWVFIAHPALVFSNGLPFSMTSLSAIMIPLFGVFLMKRQWMLSKRFGFITPSEMISVYFKSDLIRILIVIIALLFSIPFLALQLSFAGKMISMASDGVVGSGSGSLLMGAVIIIYVGLIGIRSIIYIDTLQFFLFIFGLIALGFIAYDLSGGWDLLNESLSRVSTIKERMFNVSHDYSAYLAIPGTITSTEILDKNFLYTGKWTSSMVLTFSFALTGILLSPNFSMLTFSSREVEPFASQQAWLSGLLMGFVLIFFTLGIGLSSVLLGANSVVNSSGINISNVLPEIIFPNNIDTLVPHLVNLIGEYSPIFFSILVVCSIATFQSTSNFYLSSSAMITRDIIKRFFFNNMKSNEQIFTSRIIVMFIFFIALFISLSFSGKILSLANFSLSMGCQMLVPLIALCYFPWFTKHGVAFGLIIGIIAVFLTDEIGQSILGNSLPWNKWPLTIHSAAWGAFFNFIAASIISFITQDAKENSHKFKFHNFIDDYKAVSMFRRSLKPSAWIVTTVWVFFAVGPGSLLGNNFFGKPQSVESWSFGMPSLWVWQIIFWIIGIFIVWFLASKMEMSTSPKKNIISQTEDIDRS